MRLLDVDDDIGLWSWIGVALRLSHVGWLAQRLRQGLNALFAQLGLDWVAYGEFSGFKLLPNYRGPRPDADGFLAYQGPAEQPKDPGLVHAFRCAMLLNGVDLPGLGGMTTAAHREADVDRTVTAVSEALYLL